MKESDSNSLRRELAAFPRVGEHPDADVLNAFAEGTLLERERDTVMAHLAGCAECREVLSLIAEEAPRTNSEVKQFPARRRPRAWMPWGAVAAGIAIACGVVVYRVEKKPVYAPTMAQNEKAPPIRSPQVAAPQQTPAAPTGVAAKKRISKVDRRARETTPAAINADKLQAKRKEQLAVDADQAAESEADYAASAPKPEAAMPARESGAERQAPANSPAFGGVTAGRAQSAEAQFASVVRPHWRLNEEGQPQRAFGDGAWQPALAGAPTGMHVLAIVGDAVWTAGEASQVFRSLDEGETWQAVPLRPKNGGSHTIAHIRFASAMSGTIEAADGTEWQTSDGGRSWR